MLPIRVIPYFQRPDSFCWNWLALMTSPDATSFLAIILFLLKKLLYHHYIPILHPDCIRFYVGGFHKWGYPQIIYIRLNKPSSELGVPPWLWKPPCPSNILLQVVIVCSWDHITIDNHRYFTIPDFFVQHHHIHLPICFFRIIPSIPCWGVWSWKLPTGAPSPSLGAWLFKLCLKMRENGLVTCFECGFGATRMWTSIRKMGT